MNNMQPALLIRLGHCHTASGMAWRSLVARNAKDSLPIFRNGRLCMNAIRALRRFTSNSASMKLQSSQHIVRESWDMLPLAEWPHDPC